MQPIALPSLGEREHCAHAAGHLLPHATEPLFEPPPSFLFAQLMGDVYGYRPRHDAVLSQL
jgi:hypothetical protein